MKWENSNDPAVIGRARAEIAKAVAAQHVLDGTLRRLAPLADCGGATPDALIRLAAPADAVNAFLAAYAPPVLDPFAGGGSIPLEAQRLGLRAHASDLNPVPVLINKALIEIPPKFAGLPPVHPKADRRTEWPGAAGLAEDVRRYGRWMRDEAEKRIGHLYPKAAVTPDMAKARPDLKPYAGQDLTVIAWLWARTVPSPDPAMAGRHVPLVKSFWLSKKKGKEAWVRPVVDRAAGTYRFEVRTGKPPDDFDPNDATVIRTGGTCIVTGTPIPFDHIRSAGKRGEMGQKLLAIVCEGGRERVYVDPLPKHERLALTVIAENYPITDLPKQALSFRVQLYGMDQHWKLFTQRQLKALVTFSDLVGEARTNVLADGAPSAGRTAHFADDARPLHQNGNGYQAYGDAVATYLGEAASKTAAFHTTLATWRNDVGKSARAFGRQALPMVWDFAEVNPLVNAGGGVRRTFRVCSQGYRESPGRSRGYLGTAFSHRLQSGHER